jgi:AraC-like DNA-binding protein
MAQREAYGRKLGERFGLDEAPVLLTRTLSKAELAVTQIKGDSWAPMRTTPIPTEAAYLIGLQVRACERHELWFDDRPLGQIPFKSGDTFFYDLRRNPIAETRNPFHSLMFYLPKSTLDGLADELDAPRVDELQCRPGVAMDDATIRYLGYSLLGAFDCQGQASRLFVDHVTLGIGYHVAATYAGMRQVAKPARGGLASWQERRAKELMNANLDGDVPLKKLAAECSLSVSHFSRAFRASTGMTPHRWLLAHRVEAAKVLLRQRDKPLSDVALACGFADQSHFTRAFANATGISPGAWRREMAGQPVNN